MSEKKVDETKPSEMKPSEPKKQQHFKINIVILTILTEIIITVLLSVLNQIDIAYMITNYGAAYVLGYLIGEFLLILIVYWIIEKMYYKIKTKK